MDTFAYKSMEHTLHQRHTSYGIHMKTWTQTPINGHEAHTKSGKNRNQHKHRHARIYT